MDDPLDVKLRWAWASCCRCCRRRATLLARWVPPGMDSIVTSLSLVTSVVRLSLDEGGGRVASIVLASGANSFSRSGDDQGPVAAFFTGLLPGKKVSARTVRDSCGDNKLPLLSLCSPTSILWTLLRHLPKLTIELLSVVLSTKSRKLFRFLALKALRKCRLAAR